MTLPNIPRFNNQQGIAHLLLLVILLAGIILAVVLVQTRTNILPHAQQAMAAPQTAFHLFIDRNSADNVSTKSGLVPSNGSRFVPGEEIRVNVAVSSDIDPANTFSAVISYPTDLLEVTSVIKDPKGDRPNVDLQNTNQVQSTTITANSACGVACTTAKQCQGARDGCTSCLPNDQGTGNICRPAKQSTICAQVITRACGTIRNVCPATSLNQECSRETWAERPGCKDFPTPCDVPAGWTVDNNRNSPAPNPSEKPVLCDASLCKREPVPAGCKFVQDGRGDCCSGQVICPSSPPPTCQPRPACLDSEPRCMIPESSDMCPPSPKTVPDYFIQFWLPQTGFDNQTGKVTLSGGVAGSGIKTTPPGKPVMATIIFKAKKPGETKIDFTDESMILRNSDSSNILTAKNSLSITIDDPSKPNLKGDIDGDGVVGIKDFSMLLSKWGSADTKADLNGDGKVNIYDFSILISNWTR